MNELSLKRTLGRVGIGTFAFLVGAWTALGRSALEKILTALALPCGILWLLLICCTVMAVSSRRREFIVLTLSALLVLTIGGNRIFADWFTRTREGQFSEIRPLDQEPFDVVVILGGGSSSGMNGRSQGDKAGDRLILAAQLYHQRLAHKLVCTGKRITELTAVPSDPSEQAFDILTALGVPADAIEQLGGRTTAEEMQVLGQRFQDSSQRVGLLTSAWHLRRALNLANRYGFRPEPLPADFVTSTADAPRPTGEIVLSLIPQAEAMLDTSKTAKEWLGSLIRR